MSNHHGAIQDCSKALELLDPPVEANAKERIKAHVRRATSLVQLGMIKEALGEFDEAIKINGRRKTDDDDNDDTDALEADREKILRMLSEKQAQT